MHHSHSFVASKDHKDYEQCTGCGSFHSTALADPVDLYEREYWSHQTGHSTFEEQIWNVSLDYVYVEGEASLTGNSKVGKVMSHMGSPGNFLELGCAPGVLMNRVRRAGYEAWGIEPDEKVIPEIILVAGCEPEKIIHGYFPDVALPSVEFKYIVAMDLVEHIEDYDRFLRAVYDKLEKKGKFIMMSPVIKDNQYRERDFSAHEHAWLFSFEYISEYLKGMYQGVVYDQWRLGHEMFICEK